MHSLSRNSAAALALSPVAERRAVFAVTAFAVAHPIFDQLGRNPEFLQLREVIGLRLWIFGLGLFLGIPGLMILLTELVGRIHRPLRLPLYRLWLGLGLGLLVLVVLRRAAPNLGSTAIFVAATFAAAIFAAAASVWIYARSRWCQEFGNILSWLVWAIPLLFFLRSGMGMGPSRTMAVEDVPAADIPTTKGQPPPIVIVVWDELPLATLLTATGEIDPDWFPGFSRLASTSTWFRDALTTSTNTLQAVPDLLSGRVADAVDPRVGLTDPRTLFKLVEATHQRFAYSAIEGLVPEDITVLGDDGTRPQRWSGLLSDLRVLYLHLTMPRRIREGLAPVSAAWGDFENRENEGAVVRSAIASVEAPASQERPPLVYLHALLPHHPWTYLPTGGRYWGNDHLVAQGLSGATDIGRWTTRPWLVVQAYQRHLLQTMYTDRLLVELIDRLVELNIWQSALVVVTADHGASFTPGQSLRVPSDSTVAEVAAVPLFVKLPDQNEPRIDPRQASILDVLPTIADICGLEIPWPVEGISLLRENQNPRRERSVRHSKVSPQRVTRSLLDEILAVAKARRHLFGRSENGAPDPFRIGPFPDLVGRPVTDFEIVALGEPWSAERVEPDLDDRLIPARVKLLIDGLDGFERPAAFAVVVDGKIVATTAAFPALGPTLSVMVREAVALRVPESLRLFRIIVSGRDQPKLEEVRLLSSSYRFSPDGDWIVDEDGDRWKIDPRAFRGEVHPLRIPTPGNPFRVLAWGVDDQDRAPERLVAFSGNRSITWARAGVPKGDFLDHLKFTVPKERVFFLVFPRVEGAVRYFVLGADGRAGELPVVSNG